MFLKIMNVMFDYNLENANLITSNFPAVDGVDYKNKVFVQITTSCTNKKISETIDKIIEKNIFEDFDTLKFVFINSKKVFTADFKKKIENKIDGRFNFEFENGIIGIKDIYRILVNEQDVRKVMFVNKILDEYLYSVPKKVNANFDYIGISFDDEEFENVKLIIEMSISKGFNVVIKSKKMFDFFQSERSKLFDNLILYKPTLDLSIVTKIIVVISKNYVQKNIDTTYRECEILQNAIERKIKTRNVTFNKYRHYKILDKNFKFPKTLPNDNDQNIQILKIIDELFKKNPISGYSFLEIEQFLKQLNPNFEIENIIKGSISSHFRVYNLKMLDNNIELNYLVFSNEFNRKDVIEEFEINYKKLFSKNLNILIPKDYDQTTDKRLESLKTTFHYANSVYYVDEFLFDKSLKNNIDATELLNNQKFIEPLFEIKGNTEKIDDILDWIKHDSTTSVAFIKGAGGIGKTTVSQKIHDEIINNLEKNFVIFLNASSYIDEIVERKRDTVDLYAIFESCQEQTKSINLNTFKSNFIQGNITLIIDGIDEIISTLPEFNLKRFVDDFEQLKEQIGRGKMIINSRDIYIDELESLDPEFTNKHKVFKLLKFDKESVDVYFENSFPSLNGKKSEKYRDCQKILLEFYKLEKPESHSYSPYVIENIVLIVEGDFNYEEIQYEFESNLLVREYNNDLLIYKICYREIAKKYKAKPPKVDDFIKFLCLLSIKKNGIKNETEFMNLLFEVGLDSSEVNFMKILKDNPFLIIDTKTGNNNFRFDFYFTLFKTNAVYSKIIDIKSIGICDSFIELLSSEFKYNSIISRFLIDKFEVKNLQISKNIENIKLLITEIKNYRFEDGNVSFQFLKKQSISNLTIFLIKLASKTYSSTEIIKNLFSQNINSKTSNTDIYDFNLINVPEDANAVFDFSGLSFYDCHVINYPSLLKCKFDSQTYFFGNCNISSINPTKVELNKITLRRSNFDKDFIGNDNSLFNLFKILEDGSEAASVSVKKYFRAFYSSNNNRINIEIEMNKLTNKNYCIPFEDLTKILIEHKIIISFNNDIVCLNKEFCGKIERYMTQNLEFIELNRILKQINIFRKDEIFIQS